MVSTSLQQQQQKNTMTRFSFWKPIKKFRLTKKPIVWAKKHSSSNSLNAFVILIWQKIRLFSKYLIDFYFYHFGFYYFIYHFCHLKHISRTAVNLSEQSWTEYLYRSLLKTFYRIKLWNNFFVLKNNQSLPPENQATGDASILFQHSNFIINI